ncbi:pyrimidine 5'-nucleotidase [Fusarium austroafricanum]|uniref:Pyrimidine 5'-nucleotidase n=1 Tax=Fusarium austroafricanum TaxID=2364996 RepID=A0A8H4KUM9_9HYPO|nr:pyrimidine 5'-nucleotidase [Fusarium austroafricanum]
MDQNPEKPVLFFDIDNCLYSRNDKVLEHMGFLIDDYFKKHLDLSPDDAEQLHKNYSKQYGQAIEGLVRHHQIDALEYNAKVDDALPLDELIKPNPQLRQFLQDIDTSKVRLWLLTNAYVNHGKRVVRLLGVEDLFEGLTYCDYSKIPFVCKPQKDMYLKAMKEAGVSDLSKCFFVDDSYNNCVGARKAGWTAIHFVEKGFPMPDTPASQYQIRHLEELRSLYPEFFKFLLWIDGNDYDYVRLSGVARWLGGHYSDTHQVPVDPNTRWDDDISMDDSDDSDDQDAEPEHVIIVCNSHVMHRRAGYCRGFVFHDTCWTLLNLEVDVDLKLLYCLCASLPTGKDAHYAIINWGHDYGGAAEFYMHNEIEALRQPHTQPETVPREHSSNPLHIPALKKAIEFSERMQRDAFRSRLNPQDLGIDKDAFALLSPEILQTILTLLPSPDIHSLRLASPVFATQGLSERFWESRFTQGKEFEYLPEVFSTPPASWRALYLSLHIWASDSLVMANRRRVWTLAKQIHGLLRQMKGNPCLGPSKRTVPELSVRAYSRQKDDWTSASRYVTPNDTEFISGCRALRTRLLEFPEHLKVGHFFGLDRSGAGLGYTPTFGGTLIRVPGKLQCIRGFEVALDTNGIRDIAIIAEDGTTLPWATGGSPSYPRRLLTDVEGISAIEAKFDAFKLVELSRNRVTPREQTHPRERFLWLPEIPRKEWIFDGLLPLGDDTNPNVPIMTVVYDDDDDCSWSDVHSIDTTYIDECHPTTLKFRPWPEGKKQILGSYSLQFDFGGPRRFGRMGDGGLGCPVNADDGEQVISLEVQVDQGFIVGIRFNSNHARTALLTPEESPLIHLPWIKIRPSGSRVIGMFSQGAGWGLQDQRSLGKRRENGFPKTRTGDRWKRFPRSTYSQLLENEGTVVAIVSRHPKIPADVSDHTRISLHAADLTVPDQIEAVFKKFNPHAIIHTASPSYLDTTTNLVKANVDGTNALLKAATACTKTSAFVFTSTDSAVIPTQEPLSEDDAVLYGETNAPNSYAMTKAMAEKLAIAANSAQLHTSALRIPAFYGKHDTNFVPQLVRSIRRKEHKMQLGKDKKPFEFLYVKKAAEAHILAMNALLDPQTMDWAMATL